jgi:hypothetical protein
MKAYLLVTTHTQTFDLLDLPLLALLLLLERRSIMC